MMLSDDLDSEEENQEQTDDAETSFRREEFNILRYSRNDDQLMIGEVDLDEFDTHISSYFNKINLITKLRETRALAGFTRIFPDSGDGLEERKRLLWKFPPLPEDQWLPAYVVYGEGIYIEFGNDLLFEWEQQVAVRNRARLLSDRYLSIQQQRRLRDRPLTPRFILLHTFSHLLMNRLTFECGYSSAALRERLYASDNPLRPMAGILIYTAAGDAEGTMGGLVRMGKAGYLEPVIRRALEGASWCSSDPVCMEMADLGGQGPDSCNLSACHSCALVPETACEEFNRFLDRGLLVGVADNPELGYFGDINDQSSLV